MNTSPIFFLIIALSLTVALAFVPAVTNRQNKCSVQLNLLGGKTKAAKSQEEDLELTRAIIMKHKWVLTSEYQAECDEKGGVDDDEAVVGNLISETVVDDVNGGEDALDKIKSFGRKIKGKFKNKK